MLDSAQTNAELAARVRDAIASIGRPKAEIAEALGVSKQAVTGWETTGRISRGSLSGLAKLAGLPLEHFVRPSAAEILSTPPPSQPGRLDVDKLTDLIETVEAAVLQSGRTLPPRTKARVLARLYMNDQAQAASSPEAVRTLLASLLDVLE